MRSTRNTACSCVILEQDWGPSLRGARDSVGHEELFSFLLMNSEVIVVQSQHHSLKPEWSSTQRFLKKWSLDADDQSGPLCHAFHIGNGAISPCTTQSPSTLSRCEDNFFL